MMRYAALTLAAASMASAQTFSSCNPVKGDDCPADPAFGGQAAYDFRTASQISDLESFFIVDGGIKYNPQVMSFNADTGGQMTVFGENDAPTLTSRNYLFFGKVEVEVQAAPGAGIVTSIVLQSDALDEIDWEFIGNDQNHVQSNFYALGVNDYTHGRYHPVTFNPMSAFHTYTIEWTADAIVFSIDGNAVRTALPAEGRYPQTPMQLKLGTWVGGKGPNQGTVDWAGGFVDWSQAPFAAFYRSVKIWDYAGGNNAGATQYQYSKPSDGTWESIIVVGAGNTGRDNNGFANRQSPPVSSAAPFDVNSTIARPSTTSSARLTGTGSAPTGTGSGGNGGNGGNGGAQTTLQTTTGAPARSPVPAPGVASSIQGSLLVAGLASFIAAMML